jgi:hypothetical protein
LNTKNENKLHLERHLTQTKIIVSNLEEKLEFEEKKVVFINYLIREKNDEVGIVKVMSNYVGDLKNSNL